MLAHRSSDLVVVEDLAVFLMLAVLFIRGTYQCILHLQHTATMDIAMVQYTLPQTTSNAQCWSSPDFR